MKDERSEEIDTGEIFSLEDRVAIVTGGAGLLGSQFCEALARAGATVVVADSDPRRGSELAQTLEQAEKAAHFIRVDVSDRGSVQRLVEATLTSHGRVDILVNSAALDPKFDPHHDATRFGRFEDLSLEEWNQAVAVNLTGMFLACQAVAGAMLEQGKGSIVNMCSTYGLVGPDQRIYQQGGEQIGYKPAHYSVTKAGALGLTRYLAAYFAGSQVRVNALSPGGVYNDHEEGFVKRYSARTILGRMARKDELNGAVLFLASDASSYMTGANLVVDGGWMAW